MQWNKIKVSVHTVNIWHFTELKEKRKIESRRTAKKTCIWNIRWFVNLWKKLDYSIEKTCECFATDNQYQENVLEKIKEI